MSKEETKTWICPECKHKEEWGYKELAEKGEPVCPECDTDMKLKKGENYD